MSAIKTIFTQGVFRPLHVVDFPEGAKVTIEAVATDAAHEQFPDDKVRAILSRRYDSGETDVAERHNEHQP